MASAKQRCRFYVATFGDLGLDVTFIDDPLQYGRAVNEARRQHRIGKYDSYVHGPVSAAPIRNPRKPLSEAGEGHSLP